MLFYTKKFLIFWIVCYFFHFLFRNNKNKWQLSLLIFSCFFYSFWDFKFLTLMVLVALSDFFLAIWIESSENKSLKSKIIFISIVANLSLLAFFKYFNFFISSFNDFSALFGFKLSYNLIKIVLPIGISFYTFESLSYVIEVYRGHIKASRKFQEYFLFVAFFPHLVAGPIIQPKNLIEQFRIGPQINSENFRYGIWRFFWGLLKKLLIADQLAFYLVDPVFNFSQMFNSIDVMLGVVGYSFQIYFDFSGYSDMAIGLAKVFGFDLPENFNYPYLAKNFRDFWKRWHISLSTWLRDYLYFSLGGNKNSTLLKYRNIFITMVLGGIWHGASYNFIIWGLLHGFFIIISHFMNDFFNFKKMESKILNFIQIFSTFVLVSFAWIFFRADNLNIAISIIKRILEFNFTGYSQFSPVVFIFLLVSIFYFTLANYGIIQKIDLKFIKKVEGKMLYFLMVFIILLILIFDKQYSPFIYFQF